MRTKVRLLEIVRCINSYNEVTNGLFLLFISNFYLNGFVCKLLCFSIIQFNVDAKRTIRYLF